jgi:AcrR family transcriptional regulator
MAGGAVTQTAGEGQAPVRDRYHAGLSREIVVAAAVDLLRTAGTSGFSLRRLAGGLGVDNMALYKHVRNKDDLLGAALADVFKDARPAEDGEWWQQVASIFTEHRRVIHAEPWALAVLLSHGTSSAEPWAGVDEALALLQPRLGAAGAARWMRWLAAYTNGFLLAEPEVSGATASDQIAAERPRVSAAAARNARTGSRDFTAGLQVLVDAMRAEGASREACAAPRT